MCLEKFVRVVQRMAALDGGRFQAKIRTADIKVLCHLPVVLGIAVLVAGCGETYRPVVTPVAVTGPAPQPQSFAVVTTTAGKRVSWPGKYFRWPR